MCVDNVLSTQEKHDEAIQGLPLLEALLQPPNDFPSSATSTFIKGEMLISNRLQHTKCVGTEWMAAGELNLLISTVLWDGCYNHLCFVLPCVHSATGRMLRSSSLKWHCLVFESALQCASARQEAWCFAECAICYH